MALEQLLDILGRDLGAGIVHAVHQDIGAHFEIAEAQSA